MRQCLYGIFFFLRFYLSIHERHTEREAETQAEGEAAPCREPYVGLDPRTPGSRPGPKAGAKPLSHPGIPSLGILIQYVTSVAVAITLGSILI